MSGNSVRHLVYAGQERENRAVDILIGIGRLMHPRWLESLGVDPERHWCLLRPKLMGVHPKVAEAEVDIIFGNIGSREWPPSTDMLVAVEAKCWAKKQEDIDLWSNSTPPKTNLWNQVQRNHECGFDRVAGIDIICTEPGTEPQDYWEAIRRSNEASRSEAPWLLEEGCKSPVFLRAGYAVLTFGAIKEKDERYAGTPLMIKLREAPLLKPHNKTTENAIRLILESCPQPPYTPYHFRYQDNRWIADSVCI